MLIFKSAAIFCIVNAIKRDCLNYFHNWKNPEQIQKSGKFCAELSFVHVFIQWRIRICFLCFIIHNSTGIYNDYNYGTLWTLSIYIDSYELEIAHKFQPLTIVDLKEGHCGIYYFIGKELARYGFPIKLLKNLLKNKEISDIIFTILNLRKGHSNSISSIKIIIT